MGDAIYNQAVKEMKSLAEHVMQDIQEFADEHDYEQSWVVERRTREDFGRDKTTDKLHYYVWEAFYNC